MAQVQGVMVSGWDPKNHRSKELCTYFFFSQALFQKLLEVGYVILWCLMFKESMGIPKVTLWPLCIFNQGPNAVSQKSQNKRQKVTKMKLQQFLKYQVTWFLCTIISCPDLEDSVSRHELRTKLNTRVTQIAAQFLNFFLGSP